MHETFECSVVAVTDYSILYLPLMGRVGLPKIEKCAPNGWSDIFQKVKIWRPLGIVLSIIVIQAYKPHIVYIPLHVRWKDENCKKECFVVVSERCVQHIKGRAVDQSCVSGSEHINQKGCFL